MHYWSKAKIYNKNQRSPVLDSCWEEVPPMPFMLSASWLKKFCEGQQSLHRVFIDLEKAFDRVPREELWNCLRLKGIPENYVRIIQDMYKDCRTQVRCAGGLSDSFEVKVGVHQGSALSPLIFIIIMDCLTDAVRRETPWDMMFTEQDKTTKQEARQKKDSKAGLKP